MLLTKKNVKNVIEQEISRILVERTNCRKEYEDEPELRDEMLNRTKDVLYELQHLKELLGIEG